MTGDLLEYQSPDDRHIIGNALEWWLNEFVPASGKTITELRDQIAAELRIAE